VFFNTDIAAHLLLSLKVFRYQLCANDFLKQVVYIVDVEGEDLIYVQWKCCKLPW